MSGSARLLVSPPSDHFSLPLPGDISLRVSISRTISSRLKHRKTVRTSGTSQDPRRTLSVSLSSYTLRPLLGTLLCSFSPDTKLKKREPKKKKKSDFKLSRTMASSHGELRHLLPESYKRLIASWLEEDCPSFDYGGFVVGESEGEARLLGKSKVRFDELS